MRTAILLFGLVLASPACHAGTRIHGVSGEDLLRDLEKVDPAAVPWTPESTISREELAYHYTVRNVEFVRGYIAALRDATQGTEWCVNTRYKDPKPDTLWDQSRLGLEELSKTRLKENAAALLIELWRAKWPCSSISLRRPK